jgi:hypothetical protein
LARILLLLLPSWRIASANTFPVMPIRLDAWLEMIIPQKSDSEFTFRVKTLLVFALLVILFGLMLFMKHLAQQNAILQD